MLVRQGAVYHFRRRIPERLHSIIRKREVWYSLRTSDRNEAKARAAALWVWTDRVFGRPGVNGVKSRDEIETLLKLAQNAIETGEDAADILLRLDHAIELEEARQSAEAAKAEAAESKLSALRFAADVATRERDFGVSLNNSIAQAKAMLHGTKGRLVEARQARKGLENVVSSMAAALASREAPAALPKESPMFGELLESFVKNKAETTEDHRGYSLQTQKQTRVTLALWADLMGEKPVRDYTRGAGGRTALAVLYAVPSAKPDGSRQGRAITPAALADSSSR